MQKQGQNIFRNKIWCFKNDKKPFLIFHILPLKL